MHTPVQGHRQHNIPSCSHQAARPRGSHKHTHKNRSPKTKVNVDSLICNYATAYTTAGKLEGKKQNRNIQERGGYKTDVAEHLEDDSPYRGEEKVWTPSHRTEYVAVE